MYVMNTEFSIITYNINGLPWRLDLRELPWYLKPIAWIVKLIRGTTELKIASEAPREDYTKDLGHKISEIFPDLVCFQEDFQYHKILQDACGLSYAWGTWTGGFDLGKLLSSMKLFPKPHFKADGLGLAVKDSRVRIVSEDIIPWETSYGYVSHASDELTAKGFRHYRLLVSLREPLDLYIVHLDADWGTSGETDIDGDIEARGSQLRQLAEYIKTYPPTGPVVIVGDTNSDPRLPWDVDNLDQNLWIPLLESLGLVFQEAVPQTTDPDVDRLWWSGNALELVSSDYRTDFGGLSDHRPLLVKFKYTV